MTAILLGLQGGYTKFPCFFCLWDSRADDQHCLQRDWPVRETFTPGVCNVKADSLVNPRNILFPPLHIKLGLMKNFFKALDKVGQSFRFIQTKSLHVSDAKLCAGVFDGPQIRELMKDSGFDEILTGNEKTAWISFKHVCTNFLGKKQSQDYEEIVGVLMQNFQALGDRISIKMHFCIPILITFQRTVVITVRSKVKDFTRTLGAWKNDIKVAGVSTCCPTTVDILSEMFLPHDTHEELSNARSLLFNLYQLLLCILISCCLLLFTHSLYITSPEG